MEGHETKSPAHGGQQNRSLDYLRRRSLHRIWWSSANVAVRRGHSTLSGATHPPNGHGAIGKRV
jgi:hypothetical protein